jgi:histidinol-phosphate aminotransferase
MWIPSANRDDELFTDPDRFDVSRQPNRHLALGFGEHFCVGSNLTRVEIRLLYQKLIDRSLTIEPDGEPRRLGSIVVNGLEHMPVKLVPGRYLSGTRQVFNWLIVTIERETMMAAGTPLVAPPRAGTRLHLSENPYGPSPHAVQAVTDSLRCLHRYPDPSYHDLITGIAFHYNIDPDRVVVGNGADEIILMLALAAREAQRPAIISENTFQSYSMSLRAAGVPVTAHPLIDYSFPVEEFIASFGAGASIAFVCNPHNPVGGILSAESVDCLCAVARQNDVIVVFDEAYAEYTDGEGFRSAISAAANDRNVCVMRTFSKAYGLAALRIGYVVGDPAVVARLRHMQMAFPFHVNRMGQAAAIAALRDQEYLTRIREKNRVARDLLYLGLSDLGITYFPSHANFVLAHLPGSASHVARELRTNAGMYVRDTADLGLTDHLRISVGRPDEMSAFVSELAQVMAATPGP